MNMNVPIIRIPSSPKTVNFSPLPSNDTPKQIPQIQIPKSPLSLLQKSIRILNASNSTKSIKRFSQELSRAMPDQSQSEYFRETPNKYYHKTIIGLSTPKNSKSHFAAADQSADISRNSSSKKPNLIADITALRKENSNRSLKGSARNTHIENPKSVRSSIKKHEISPGLSQKRSNTSKLSGSQSSSPDNSPLASKAKNQIHHGKSLFGKGYSKDDPNRKGSTRRLLLKNRFLLGNIIRRKSCHCSDCGGISAFEKKHLNIAIPPTRAIRFKDQLLVGLRKQSKYPASPSDMSMNSKRSSNRTNSNYEGPDAVLEDQNPSYENKMSLFKTEHIKDRSESRERSKNSVSGSSLPRIKERATVKDEHQIKKMIESLRMIGSIRENKGKSLDMKEKAVTHIELEKSSISSSSAEEASSDEEHSLGGLSGRSSKEDKKSADIRTGGASKTSNSSMKENNKKTSSSGGSKKSQILGESSGKIDSPKKRNGKYYESMTVMRKITENFSPGVDAENMSNYNQEDTMIQKDDETMIEKVQSPTTKVRVIHRNPIKISKKNNEKMLQSTYRQQQSASSIEKKPNRMTTSCISPLRKIRARVKKGNNNEHNNHTHVEPRLSSPITHSCLNLKTARLKALEVSTEHQNMMMSMTMRSPVSPTKSILEVEKLYMSTAAKKLSAMKIKLSSIVMKKPAGNVSSRVGTTIGTGAGQIEEDNNNQNKTKRNEEQENVNLENNKKRISERRLLSERSPVSKNLSGRIFEKLKTDKMMLLDIERMAGAYESPVKYTTSHSTSNLHIIKKSSK